MKKQINLVKKFHKKFKVPILPECSLIPKNRSDLRYRLMKEEVTEYLQGVKNKDLSNIANEIADILYSVYGTILEHGLQDKIEDIFHEVHNSNMTKEYHEFKMIKGIDYIKPDIEKALKKKKVS